MIILLSLLFNYFQFIYSSQQIIEWDGSSSVYDKTLIVGDTLQWTSLSEESFTFQSDSIVIQSNELHNSYTSYFYVLGTYTYTLNNTASGTITVTSGAIFDPTIYYYELLVGDILRWEWDPETETTPDYQTNLGDSTHGVGINDYGRYDFQFLIPGYYGWYDSQNNWVSIYIRAGVTIPWSSSSTPVVGKIGNNEFIRLVWDKMEFNSVNITLESNFGVTSYSLGATDTLGSIFNISTSLEYKAITITSDVNPTQNLYARFEIEEVIIVYWVRVSTGALDIQPNTTIRFYGADNIRHNVRIEAAPLYETISVSNSFKSPGTYVDVFFNTPGLYRASCDYHSTQVINITVIGSDDDNNGGNNDDDDDDDDNSNGGGCGHVIGGNAKPLLQAVELTLFMVGLLGLGSYLLDVGQNNQNDNWHHDGRNNNWNNNYFNYNNNQLNGRLNPNSFHNNNNNKNNLVTSKNQKIKGNSRPMQMNNVLNTQDHPVHFSSNDQKPQQHISDFAMEQIQRRAKGKKLN